MTMLAHERGRFSLKYLLLLVAGVAVSLAFSVIPLQQGFSPHEKITFKKIGWDDGFLTIKYEIDESPNFEIVLDMTSWRHAAIAEIKP